MRTRGMLYLGISLATFAVTHVIEKKGVTAVDPSAFAVFRMAGSMLFSWVIWMALQPKGGRKISKASIRDMAIIGSLASGLALWISMKGLSMTTATNLSVQQTLHTAATMAIAYFLLGERLPKLYLPMLGLMTIGIALLTSKGFVQWPNTGDWILLSTVPIVGFGNVYAKRTMKNIDAATLSMGRFLFGTLFLALTVLPFLSSVQIGTIMNGWNWLLLSSVLNGVRLLTFYAAIKTEGPTLPATILAVSPAFTSIIAYFTLGETFTPLQMLGIAMAVGAAVAVTRMRASYKNS